MCNSQQVILKWKCNERVFTSEEILDAAWHHGHDGVASNPPQRWGRQSAEPDGNAPEWARQLYDQGYKAGVSCRQQEENPPDLGWKSGTEFGGF